jgi:poly-gamma-glutamate capsule biosynthesis protein CapA/YwtB (metallophosphatase superfamily)
MADGPRHLASAPSRGRRQLTFLALLILVLGGLGIAAYVDRSQQDSSEDVAAVGGGSSDGTTTDDDPARGTDPADEADPAGGADPADAGNDAADDTAPPATEEPTTTTTRDPLGSGETVTIAFAGDMYFEGVLRQRLDSDPATAVGPFSEVFQRADLAVGNLETVLGEGGTPAPKQFTFIAPAHAVDALRAAGFDTMSMANNHGMDYGLEGLEQSLAIKRAQPDDFLIGIGGDEDEAFAPFVTEVKGQRIAVIAATQVLDSSLLELWTAGPDKGGLASAKRVDRLVAEVERARAENDTVVVFLHWGIEGQTCPSGDQQTLADTLVAAGADIVVGGHAHRVQGGGRLGDAVIHYGLGNFLFKENSAEGARTGVLEVDVTGRRIDGYRWVPGRISGSVPYPLEGAEAEAALQHWDGLRSCTNLTP